MTLICAGLVIACLVFELWRRDRRIDRLLTDNIAERRAHDGLFERLVSSHRAEVAQLHQARMEETANLLQRIQAPEQAVASHVADAAPPDPPPVNLDNDAEMLELYEQRMRGLGVIDG